MILDGMGWLKTYTNDDGLEVELQGHEGYIERELHVPWFESDDFMATFDAELGTWWSSSWVNVEPIPTGRWRPVCACGWRAGVVDVELVAAAGQGVFGEGDLALPAEVTDEQLMAPWVTHVGEIIAERTAISGLHEAAEAVRKADARLRHKVLLARRAGRSWREIGRALGVSGQAAHQRFAELDMHDDAV